MTPTKNKATFIVRVWTEVDPVTEADWCGTAERVGTDRQHKFREFNELVVWMRQELAGFPSAPPTS